MGVVLEHRQISYGYEGYDNYYWWDSPTVIIIKWIVLVAILLVIFAFFVVGYLHAKRRMKKGLAPLPYHRWLIPRARRAQFESQQHPEANPFSFYGSQRGNEYNLHPVPPPAYNPNLAPPPSYQPPMGASKAAPDQTYVPPPTAGESSSAPPVVPVEPVSTGSTNPYR